MKSEKFRLDFCYIYNHVDDFCISDIVASLSDLMRRFCIL